MRRATQFDIPFFLCTQFVIHQLNLRSGHVLCVDSGIRVTPSFRFERILPNKHNPIKSPKTRLFRLQRSARGAQRRWGVKEMSTGTTASHPTFICPRPRVTGPAVPAARWARRPLTGHGLESQLDSTAVNDLFTVISHK